MVSYQMGKGSEKRVLGRGVGASSTHASTTQTMWRIHQSVFVLVLFLSASSAVELPQRRRRQFATPSASAIRSWNDGMSSIGGCCRYIGVLTTTTTTTTTFAGARSGWRSFERRRTMIVPRFSVVDDVESLDDISREYFHIFPRTAECIRALSSTTSTSSTTSASPSAEEFLMRLSTEIVRASSSSVDYSPTYLTSVEATKEVRPTASVRSSSTTWCHDDFVEVGAIAAVPFVATAAVVAAASTSYDMSRMTGSKNMLRNLASSIPTDAPVDIGEVVTSSVDSSSVNLDHGVLRDHLCHQAGSSLASVGGGGVDVWGADAIANARGFLDGNIPFVGGGGMLSALASSIPTDQQVGVSVTDDAFDSLDRMGDYFGSRGYNPLEGMEGSWYGAMLSKVAEIGTLDTIFDEGANAVVPDQASVAHEALTDGLTDPFLSQQLFDLNYPSLQQDDKSILTEGFNAVDTGSTPMPHVGGSLINSIKGRLDRLELPQYHIEMPQYHVELPTMAHLFSDELLSVENALPSIKVTTGTTEDNLAAAYRTITHSFDDLNAGLADLSNSFGGLSGQITVAGNEGKSGISALMNSLQESASRVPAPRSFILNMEGKEFNAPDFRQFHVNLPTLPNARIIDGTTAFVQRIGDSSLSDFGNAVLSACKFTGGIVVRFLDFILAISGNEVASIIANIQSSVTTTVDTASYAIIETLTKIGTMSVSEIVQDIMKLVIIVTDMLLKVMNAILYVISGKDGAAWAIQATTSINGASSQLLARATSTYDDFTHASLTEMAHSIGDYGQLVGGEFSTLIASLMPGTSEGVSLADVSIPNDVLDSVASALQTAVSYVK